MEYSVGKVGRVVVMRFSQGEDFLKEIEALCVKEGIKSALFHIIGGVNSADIVSGPALESMPPVPIVSSIDKMSEILGTGTIFESDEGRPMIHLHAAVAKGDGIKVGCIRGETKTFLVSEVVIYELLDIDAKRVHDEKSGFKLLKIFDTK